MLDPSRLRVSTFRGPLVANLAQRRNHCQPSGGQRGRRVRAHNSPGYRSAEIISTGVALRTGERHGNLEHMSVTQDRARTSGGKSFESLSPATGEVVATLPINDEGEVREAVQRARKAAQWWRDLGFDGRGKRLRAYTGVLTRRREELLELISRENGKPRVDAFIEHLLAVEHLDWAARNARRIMRPRKVGGSMLLANVKPILEYQPLGVVG